MFSRKEKKSSDSKRLEKSRKLAVFHLRRVNNLLQAQLWINMNQERKEREVGEILFLRVCKWQVVITFKA